MSVAPASARSVAARVLVRVEKDRAFAAAALDAELGRAVQLDPRDRALATELVYGVLRLKPWLTARLARHASRGLKTTDVEMMAPMLVCAYELAALERVPAFASVNEAVNLVRARRGAKVAGFANALLRKVAADGRASASDLDAATWESAGSWLKSALVRVLGDDGARAFLANTREPPPLGLRVDTASREEVIAAIASAKPDAMLSPGAVSPRAILVRGGGATKELLAAAPSGVVVQEEGAQVVGLALGVRAGDVVLDACAGRGGKTSLFVRQATAGGASGAVDASDLHPQKLERLKMELASLGLAPRATYAVDLSKGVGAIAGLYDRVLVDAPCTGTGTLRRRPEIATGRDAASLAEIARTQIAIALRASSLVKKGGRLLYAVCSILREEAEDVVAEILARDSSLSPSAFDDPTAMSVAGADATSFRLLPHVHGTDGYFAASFEKRG
jgi:16S rRNA (cytosine967-C5)-methyltransferase